MNDFEREVTAGLARIEERVGGVENAVGALTVRFEESERARQGASVAHAERFARIEAAVTSSSTNGEGRWWRRQIERYGPLILAALFGGAVSGGAVRVSFGAADRAAVAPPAGPTLTVKGGPGNGP